MQLQDIDKTRHNVQYTQHLVLTLYGAARHGRRFLFRVVVVEVYYPALAAIKRRFLFLQPAYTSRFRRGRRRRRAASRGPRR